jgi:hypothetical protein
MFRTVPLSIIRSYSLQDQDGTAVPSWSCSKAVYKPVWHIPLLSVQWITPDDGQKNCPKHVEFHFQNTFEKLVHLVGFIIRNFVTMHGHTNEKKIWSMFTGRNTRRFSLRRRSQWLRSLRGWSTAARLLRLWVRIPPGRGCLSVVCFQGEVSATGW